jgi:epimerase transport system membrane fusion protein
MAAVISDREFKYGVASLSDQAIRLTKAGWWIVLAAMLPTIGWMTFAPLSMAVIGPAYVKVDLNRRPVQHLEGGIVSKVLVRDGQRVTAGDPVLVLGDVGVDAEHNRLAYRVHVEHAGIARLQAEQIQAKSLLIPDDLQRAMQQDERVREAAKREIMLFESRRNSLASELALMHGQRGSVEQEAAALRAQIAQMQSALALQRKELDVNRRLLHDGFISPTRVTQMEAAIEDYGARLEERRSELARAAQRMGDIELKIKSTQNTYVQTASDQLKIASARLAEIEQEVRKTNDAAARQTVVAPAGGNIIDLKFTSPGAVVRSGEVIAEVVPDEAQLVLEARIRPEEINQVHQHQRTRIQMSALKYRRDSMLTGKVSYVSADRLIDRATNQPYFSVLITVDAASLSTVNDLKLQAGLPAEVYIEGSKQTPLQYLLEPVTKTIRRAGKDM